MRPICTGSVFTMALLKLWTSGQKPGGGWVGGKGVIVAVAIVPVLVGVTVGGELVPVGVDEAVRLTVGVPIGVPVRGVPANVGVPVTPIGVAVGTLVGVEVGPHDSMTRIRPSASVPLLEYS